MHRFSEPAALRITKEPEVPVYNFESQLNQ